MYNLLYFQIIVKLCSSLSETECDQIIAEYGTNEIPHNSSGGFGCLSSAIIFVLKVTNKCEQFRFSATFGATTVPVFASPSTSSQPQINLNVLEQQLQKLCLPYLRIATLLRHHLYEQSLPEIEVPEEEFVRLVDFLELATIDSNWMNFDAANALCFVPGHEQQLPESWCIQLMNLYRGKIADPDDINLVISQHMIWEQPRLLRLPREYEKLFTVNYTLLLTF